MEKINAKPILFSTEMVKALLLGRKTQTRRVIKPQPVYRPEHPTHKALIPVKQRNVTSEQYFDFDSFAKRNAPHKPENILYVRETFFSNPCQMSDATNNGNLRAWHDFF